MSRDRLPISSVSVDEILDGGDSVHERDDGRLHLGPLPEAAIGETLSVEVWDRQEGRVVDRRYRPDRDPPRESVSAETVEARLSMNDPNLRPGDYVIGFVRENPSGDDPILLTGGYRIEISDVRVGELVIARVNEAKTQTFGANHAVATRSDYPSAFCASEDADLGLKRLMADGSWGTVHLGELERSIVPEAVRRVDDGKSVSILNPGFDPEFSLRIAIELLYHSRLGSNVALLTSGTSVHWGQKGDVRNAYRGYGLTVDEGESETAVPMDQLFAHSYVYDGELKTSSESLLDRRLVLTKKIDELSAVTDLAAIVVDYTSRKPGSDEETIDRLRDQFPNTPIVSIASLYTKNEGEGVPRYGPPTFFEGDDTLPRLSDVERVSDRYDPQVGRTTIGVGDDIHASGLVGSPIPPSTTDLLGILREPDVEVQSVECGGLSRWFDVATEKCDDLHDHGVEQAAYKVYSVQKFFERLPVLPQQYNEWIRREYADGKRYLPETTDGILEDLETYGGQIDDLQAPASIFGAVKALTEIEEGLRKENPMFERIRDEVSDAVDEGYRLGIFCPRKSWVHMLEEALRGEGFADDVVGSNVVILNSDTVRDVPPCRRLLFTGSQRPQYAGFYLHPRAKETVVLSYDGRWADTVERHAKQYVRQLNVATSGSRERPYPVPSSDSGRPTEVETGSGGQLNTGETSESGIPQKGETNTPKVDVGDLDGEELRRLTQLAELAPTKNSELADAWGCDSGSEVYQYLSSHLEEYYTRNEDKLMVLTEKGERMVEKTADDE